MTEVKSDHERAVDALYDLVDPMLPDRDDVSSGYLAEMAAKMITGQRESIDRLGALLEDYYEAGVILGLYGVKEDTSLPIGIIQALARAAYSQAPAQPPSTNAVDPVAQRGQEAATRDDSSSPNLAPVLQPGLREMTAAFVERCEELRNGSPNAFYMHVDAFCKSVLAAPDPHGEPKPALDTTCFNEIGRSCRELWPDSQASWCQGCWNAMVDSQEPSV